MVKALSSHPRNLAKVLPNSYIFSANNTGSETANFSKNLDATITSHSRE